MLHASQEWLVGGKMHNIIFNPFAAMLQNKLHVSVTHFTVALQGRI